MGKFGPTSCLGLREQQVAVRQLFPEFETRITGSVLTVEGVIQPRSVCQAYTVRIEYEYQGHPETRVLEPELVPLEEGGVIPHMYSDNTLCLYLPSAKEWTGDMQIARTIIPWTSEWLFFYEMWTVTGEWLGGGVEHGSISAPLGKIE